jgi:hypothetical protein
MKLSLIAQDHLDEVDNELIIIRHELIRLKKHGNINEEQFIMFSRLIKVCMGLQASVINAARSLERDSKF